MSGPADFEVLRERVVQALCAHFARDRLTTEELDSRLERAHQAREDGQLASLVVDLPPLADNPLPWVSAVREEAQLPVTQGRAPMTSRELRSAEVDDYADDSSRRIVAVMSEVKRHGAWIPPRTIECLAVMANLQLDFRDAILPPGVTEVKANAVMSEIRITVSPDVRVEIDGSAFMGAFHTFPTSLTINPDVPVLRISGFAFMAQVLVECRYPGESRRDAKRRERETRRLAR